MTDLDQQSIAQWNAHLREENIRLRSMITAFETSRSWRLTAPLRSFADFLRRNHILPELSQKYLRGLLSTYQWNENPIIDIFPAPRIAVVAHIYYPDLADEIADAVQKCGTDATVIVTYVDPSALPQIKSSFADHHLLDVEYLLVENLGRDMWPFLQALRSESLNDVDAILKVHTKKSLHLEHGKGDEWRQSLLQGLVPNENMVANLASAFMRHPQIAWACPTEWVAGNESWGRNKSTVRDLLATCGLKKPRTLIFPAGSMFWLGRKLRLALLSLNLTPDQFSVSPGLDGSFEHGLERFIGSWAIATKTIMYRLQAPSTAGTNEICVKDSTDGQLGRLST